MIRNQWLLGGVIAAVSIVACSTDADARCGCAGRGWRRANYGYSNYNNYNGNYNYASTGGYGTYNTTNAVTVTNPGMNQTAVNSTVIPPNGNVSVNRPTYENPAPVNEVIAPATPVNTVPHNQGVNQGVINSSPDADNEGRNASKIQGTAPTKAPAPAANLNP